MIAELPIPAERPRDATPARPQFATAAVRLSLVFAAGVVTWRYPDLALDVCAPVAVILFFWPSLFRPRVAPRVARQPFTAVPTVHMAALDPNAPSLTSDGDVLSAAWERMAYYHVLALGQAAHPVPNVPTDIPTAAVETLSPGARLACEVVLTKIPARLAYPQDQFSYLTTAYLLRHYDARSLGELERRAHVHGRTLEELLTSVQGWLSGYFFAPNDAKREIRMLRLPTIPSDTDSSSSALVRHE